MRSPYSLEMPPPAEPPRGVLMPSLWPVQVRWWLRHTPKKGTRTCAACGQSWPCHSWACWDGQLGDAVQASRLSQQPATDRRAITIPAPRREART